MTVTGVAGAQSTSTYHLFVGSEGDDYVSLVRFGPTGFAVDRKFRVGRNPTEPLGPHGLGVSPDKQTYYVSTAHGTPNGQLFKFSTATDAPLGRVTLGNFPASLQVSPDGGFVWVVNFNLHGDMKPSSVSVVYAPEMVEVARITTCTMPHGSRLSPDGKRHWSACMMDDALVEIDATTLSVARHFMLAKGAEHGMAGAPAGGHGHGAISCSPTWTLPSVDGTSVFVACNKSNDIAEIDVPTWKLKRRIPTGDGVYNLAATPDGRVLVGTNKRGHSISIIEIGSGKELARIPTKRRVPSGIVISPDSRYAFVTLEGIGSEPGTVEAFDLVTMKSAGSVDVGQQAGGIDLWKVTP